MRNISNMAGYENMMVCASKLPETSDVMIGNSYWIDIKGYNTSKHYIKA